jgi:hypothetical protein
MVATTKAVSSLAHGARYLSKRLLASYILDWVLILYVPHGLASGFSVSSPD